MMESGNYWVYDRSELEDGWSIQHFDGKSWDEYSDGEKPDIIGVKVVKSIIFFPCPECGETGCLEVSNSFRVRCGYCNFRGPAAIHNDNFYPGLSGAVELWNQLIR